MKIVQKRSPREGMKLAIWLLSALLLLAVFVFSSISPSTAELTGFLATIQRTANLRPAAAGIPILSVNMPFENYNQILTLREDALNAGVVLGDEQTFVTADIAFEGQTIPVRIRLRNGTAAHLAADDKWNFDVRTRNNETLLDMQRFYLIDPADNNWLNEWAFLQSLKREGVLAGRYQFVNLFLNGDDRGIYALQEGFGQELIAANGRPPGVIVEFDATPFWESIAYFGGDRQAAVADPVTNFSADDFRSFEVDTFRDAGIAASAELSAQKDEAIAMLRGLQSGELPAAEVFDVDKMGRFLALTDLWAATQGVSLVNLRYYFNPDSGLLEPIGFNAGPLHSDERLPLAATYYDPDIQAAYVTAAARISHPDYLAKLRAEVQPQLETMQRSLLPPADMPAPWDALSKRQQLLSRSLNPLQPVFANLGPPAVAQEGVIQIDVASAVNLPVEILGFDIDGATFLDVDPAWITQNKDAVQISGDGRVTLQAKANDPNPALRFVRFQIPLTEIIAQDKELDFLHAPQIQVATRLSGLMDTWLTPARP